MRKPKITQYLQALGVKGRTFLEKVLDGEKIDGEKPNIKTRVDIAKFFDDKEFGKAVQHTDVTSNGEKVSFSVINFGDKIE